MESKFEIGTIQEIAQRYEIHFFSKDGEVVSKIRNRNPACYHGSEKYINELYLKIQKANRVENYIYSMSLYNNKSKKILSRHVFS